MALELPEGVEAGVIQPGKTWQNGQVESFFDKLGDEVFGTQLFGSGEELNSAVT